jgi:hypothetical protein
MRSASGAGSDRGDHRQPEHDTTPTGIAFWKNAAKEAERLAVER